MRTLKKSSFASSKYYGVSLRKNGDWTSQISVNNKKIFIYQGKSEKEAALKYNEFIINNNLNRKLNDLDM